MKRVIAKINQFRQHQYFELLAAVGVLILALAAYFTIFNKSYLVVILNRDDATILVDGKNIEDAKVVDKKHIIRLFPGTHTVRISAPNVVEYAQTISLIRGLYKTVNPVFSVVPDITESATADVQFLTAGPNKNTVLYLGDGGRVLYSHNLKTNKRTPLTRNTLSGITDIRWSPDFSLALFKKPAGVYLYDFGRYDLLHQEEKFLLSSNNATLPDWDPTIKVNETRDKTAGDTITEQTGVERRIAYFYKKDSEKSLIFANQLNQNTDRAADLSEFDNPDLTWSRDGRYIAVYGREGLAIIDVFTRIITRASINNNVSGATFSLKGNFLAYISNSNLIVINTETQKITNLNLKTTIEKVLWNSDGDFLTAAIPNAGGSSDKFVKIDVRTGNAINYVYNSTEQIKVSRIVLSADESTIIFQSNNKLFTLFLQPEE